MSRSEQITAAARKLGKRLADEGKLIEAGFAIYRHAVIPKEASPIQVRETQLAWMASAQHLFSAIMNIMDDDREPTADDLRRMEMIHQELERWRGTVMERMWPTEGRA